jgi:hypothetical protein
MGINFKLIMGLIFIILAIFIEILWLIFCFGSVLVGILLLLFAPSILFFPFNLFFALGIKLMGKKPNSKTYSYSYTYRTYNGNNYNHQSRQNSYTNPVNNLDEYYKILESNATDDFDSIKKNYRRLMKKYHYDSIVSQNLSVDEIKSAEEKTRKLNEAYSAIKEKHKENYNL